MTEDMLKSKVTGFLEALPELGGVKAWDGETSIAFATGLEDACIGISMQAWGEPFVIYDEVASVQVLVDRDGMSEEEADEFLNYNTWDLWTDGVWASVRLCEDMFEGWDEELCYANEDAIVLPQYEDCLVGIVSRKCFPSRAAYDVNKCLACEVEKHFLPKDIALDLVLDKFFVGATGNSPALVFPLPS